MIDEDFVTYLETQAAITNIVSTRIYPLLPPQNPTYPLVTYEHVDTGRGLTFSGQTEFENTDIRITGWGSTYTVAKSIRDALATLLRNFSGTMGTTTVKKLFIRGDADQYDEFTKKYLSSMLISIWYDK